ncbi:hypothetical protein P154DRAFT_124448 [Amniculicola lignicola CBS 123094]|uniref:Uncharacterized protein n=1 Tax=Amniculicola lignicola CBS 123094 TaxID=1392246 RepID=A0A6A5WUV8_9PLEO|nr:hypothetical protein P154DRAFT_124448 [Amniculicola lignicola CBS 123094]
MASTRTNRFQSFTPLRTTSTSLHRLRTAFSPSRSFRSTSPSSSTGTTSPLTRTSSPDSQRSAGSMNSIRHALMLRRKPSVLDLEMEEERHLFGEELGVQRGVLEPRPTESEGSRVVGIFEVLEGRY